MKNTMEPEKVLHEHNLKRTGCREGIIDVITKAGQPLSENEIRDRLSGNFDRTTFYRTFKTLQENSIIHKIVVNNQLVKYAIGSSVTITKSHAHFFCNICNEVRCLEHAGIDIPPLPRNYSASTIEIIIKGECATCASAGNNSQIQ
jgi:Fur family transcriptional regulator, ferric uptake regulator